MAKPLAYQMNVYSIRHVSNNPFLSINLELLYHKSCSVPTKFQHWKTWLKLDISILHLSALGLPLLRYYKDKVLTAFTAVANRPGLVWSKEYFCGFFRKTVVVISNFFLLVIFVSLCLLSYCQQDKKNLPNGRTYFLVL